MRFLTLFLLIFVFISTPLFAQNNPPESGTIQTNRVENISTELTKISKSLDLFNTRLNLFLESLNKYKGIQLSETQQKLLFGYEILNQSEQLNATLRKSLIETGEREATIKRRIGQIAFDLRQENIDRSVQLQGTTKTDEARENRRQILDSERTVLQNLLVEIENSRNQITENLRQSELFVQSFRRSLFSQIRNSMTDF